MAPCSVPSSQARYTRSGDAGMRSDTSICSAMVRHRTTSIRRDTMRARGGPMLVDDPAQQLELRKRLHAVSTFISGANSLEELLPGAQTRMLELFSAERSTIFALDTKNRHFYSLAKTGGEFKE